MIASFSQRPVTLIAFSRSFVQTTGCGR